MLVYFNTLEVTKIFTLLRHCGHAAYVYSLNMKKNDKYKIFF